MSKCHNHHKNKKKRCKDHNKCVEEILEAILEAQKKSKKKEECDISCKQAINELLGKKHKKPRKNTIPFILYCKDRKPFKATGVTTFISSCSKKKRFACFTTFIFKIKELDGNCAVLELLTFKSDKKHHSNSCPKRGQNHPCSPCFQVDSEKVKDLVKTGICINVDLSCFCGISCLPPVSL
ncbi:MAG TPA: CotY/CotZ family spore coat protein [Anoxybacillus sp.]|jgi:hypothetical protein|nr:CotY/CotZ family spore coat protein [Anoxybacillus sp.]